MFFKTSDGTAMIRLEEVIYINAEIREVWLKGGIKLSGWESGDIKNLMDCWR